MTDRTRSRIAGGIAAGLLVVGLAAGTALAAGGSTYVTSACNYESLQDNTISSEGIVFVWLKVTGSGTGPYTWTAKDKPGANTDSGDLVWYDCTRDDGKYQMYYAEGFSLTAPGSYQLTVWDGNGRVVSGDGFRLF